MSAIIHIFRAIAKTGHRANVLRVIISVDHGYHRLDTYDFFTQNSVIADKPGWLFYKWHHLASITTQQSAHFQMPRICMQCCLPALLRRGRIRPVASKMRWRADAGRRELCCSFGGACEA